MDSLIQIASDSSERWYHVVPAPAVNGNTCFSVLARPADRLVQTSSEYMRVMKCSCRAEVSLMLTLGASVPGVAGEGRIRCSGHPHGHIAYVVSVKGLWA